MTLQRYDSFALKAHYDDNGFLRDSPVVGRTGLLEYMNADGTKRTEYRLAEDAFDEASLNSLNAVPVLINHHGLVTGENFDAKKTATIGSVISAGKQDGDNIRTDIVIYSKLTTPNREISCGYLCDNVKNDSGFVDPVSGVKPDFFQKNIRYNHISLVPAGRAGSVARLNMDGAQVFDDEPADNQLHEDAELNTKMRKALTTEQFGLPETRQYPMPDKEHAGNAKARASQMLKEGKLSQADYDKIVAKANKILKEDANLKSLKLDSGLTYEVQPEVAVAYETLQAKYDAQTTALADAKAKHDACVAGAKKDQEDAKKALEEMKTKQDAAVADRVAMLKIAADKGIEKADGLTNAEIKKAVIGQQFTDLKMDGMTEIQIDAYYDVASKMKTKQDAVDAAAKHRQTTEGFVKQDSKETPAQKSSAQLLAELKQDEAGFYLKEVR